MYLEFVVQLLKCQTYNYETWMEIRILLNGLLDRKDIFLPLNYNIFSASNIRLQDILLILYISIHENIKSYRWNLSCPYIPQQTAH